MLTAQDKALLEKKGISEEQLLSQLNQFKTGFPFLRLAGAASVEKGIKQPTDDERRAALDRKSVV